MANRRDGMDAHGEDDRTGASVFGQEAVAEPSPMKTGPAAVGPHFPPGHEAGAG